MSHQTRSRNARVARTTKNLLNHRKTYQTTNHKKALESDIQKLIIQYLETQGWYVKRIQVGAAMYKDGDQWRPRKSTMKGFPDLIAIKAGTTVYIEVKTATGKLLPSQEAEHARLIQAGALVIVARSLDDLKIMGFCA